MSSRDLVVAAAGASAPSDPNFKNVSLLLSGDGTNGAQNNTFLDSSTNNFTITRNGNTTQGTFSPYRNLWSNYFDGSGDYLNAGSNAAFAFGTGDFTVEMWAYFADSGATNKPLFDTGVTSNTGRLLIRQGDSASAANVVNAYVTGTTISSPTISFNTWTHVAVVRNSGTVKIYINGTGGTGVSASGNLSQTGCLISAFYDALTLNFTGYISNVRIVKGTALYTSNFTPSTTPLTAVSGTSLLTCQSNRFIDNSSNNFTITRNGDVSVQRFSPFNPTAPYSASTIGGSGYFDGTGDYLTVADNSALELGSSQFCIESFYLPTSVAGNRVLISKRPNPSTDYGFLIYLSGSSVLVYISSGNSSYDISNGVNIGTLVVGQWHHIAIYRIANAWYASFNGSITTLNASNSSSVWNNTAAWGIGGESNGTSVVQGYIGSTRFVIGSSVYTSISAPVPTSPLTPITNTSLLLNFTNAGIPDAAMMNDLETVGNAQVSTSVKKYGTGSLYFDGTGDWLVGWSNPNLQLGSGNFTIEFWYNPSSLAAFHVVIQKATDTLNRWILYWSTSTGMSFDVASGGTGIILCRQGATTGWSNGTWYHVALVRNGNVFTMYRDGISIATATDTDAIPDTTGALYIGGSNLSGDASLNGYIDDLRITKGLARYTANFTPPAQALPTN